MNLWLKDACAKDERVFTEASEQRHDEESLHVGRRGLQVNRAESAGGSSGFYSKPLTEKKSHSLLRFPNVCVHVGSRACVCVLLCAGTGMAEKQRD